MGADRSNRIDWDQAGEDDLDQRETYSYIIDSSRRSNNNNIVRQFDLLLLCGRCCCFRCCYWFLPRSGGRSWSRAINLAVDPVILILTCEHFLFNLLSLLLLEGSNNNEYESSVISINSLRAAERRIEQDRTETTWLSTLARQWLWLWWGQRDSHDKLLD